jgi:hypothetical protein
MKFEFKQTKIPKRALKRLPATASNYGGIAPGDNLRAYKVRPVDGDVLGLVIGSNLVKWSNYKDGVLRQGFPSQQVAAEDLVTS